MLHGYSHGQIRDLGCVSCARPATFSVGDADDGEPGSGGVNQNEYLKGSLP